MTIWQILLILLSTLKCGASLYKEYNKENDKGIGVAAVLIVYAAILFLYYKAGVLVI